MSEPWNLSESQRLQFREAQIAAKATRRALVQVIVTERWLNPRTSKLEVWQAKTRDGAWTLTRLEEPGTPWAIEHESCDKVVMLAASLTKARRAVSDGTAQAALERVRAEAGHG